MVCCQCQQCQVSICCGCQMIVSDCSTDTGQRGHQSPQEGAGGRQEGGRRSPCWEFVQGICVPSPDASSSSLSEPLCTQVAAMPQSSQFCTVAGEAIQTQEWVAASTAGDTRRAARCCCPGTLLAAGCSCRAAARRGGRGRC